MIKVVFSLCLWFFVMVGIHAGSYGAVNTSSDEMILIHSGVNKWVPNPLAENPKWKKYFTDEKYSPSKEIESTWYFDAKTVKKATTEKLNFNGQPMALEGATLVWTKVVGLKPKGNKYLYYAVWPDERVTLFFGIFEKENGTRYFENVSEMEDIQKLAPGLMKEVLEKLFKAIFKPWWKVW